MAKEEKSITPVEPIASQSWPAGDTDRPRLRCLWRAHVGQLVFACKPWPMTYSRKPFIDYCLLVHIIGILVFVVLYLLDLTGQSISSIAVHVLSGYFLYILLIWLDGFEPVKSKYMFI